MEKNKVYFLIFISFFPVFSLKSNLTLIEIFYSFIIFLIPIFLISHYLIKFSLNSNYFKIYISLIIVFGIDNNFGLWNGLIAPYTFDLIDKFGVIYIPAFLLIAILTLIFFLALKYFDKNFTNVVLIFLFTIFIFQVLDGTKSHKNVINLKKKKNKNIKILKL